MLAAVAETHQGHAMTAKYFMYPSVILGESAEDVDYTLESWLNFDYKEFLQDILDVLEVDSFNELSAKTQAEERVGKLSKPKIEELRSVLQTGFEQGTSVNTIAKEISEKVNPPDLFLVSNGMIVRRDGKRVLKLSSEARAPLIAQSEITRLGVLGFLLNQKNKNIEQYIFKTSGDDHVCKICSPNNEKIFEIGRGEIPPLHAGCRCWLIAG